MNTAEIMKGIQDALYKHSIFADQIGNDSRLIVSVDRYRHSAELPKLARKMGLQQQSGKSYIQPRDHAEPAINPYLIAIEEAIRESNLPQEAKTRITVRPGDNERVAHVGGILVPHLIKVNHLIEIIRAAKKKQSRNRTDTYLSTGSGFRNH